MECFRIALRESLGAVSFVDCGDISVLRATCDSRRVQPGDLFVAVSGSTDDGRRYVQEAIARGADGILCEHPFTDIAVPQCVVPSSRAAYARICMALQSDPANRLRIAGVTGTNGKTTVTWLLRSILEVAGSPAGLIGTIEYSDGVHREPAALTTPDPATLGHWFRRMNQKDARCCAMEISSHALHQHRCAGVRLSAAAITNVTQDHFDYHRGAKEYRAAKAAIADLLQPGAALLLNADDPESRLLVAELPSSQDVIWFGTTADTRLRAQVESSSASGQQISLTLRDSTIKVRTALTGQHNVLNVLVAAALAEQLDIPREAVAAGIERVATVPGRLERVDAGQPFHVLVDYAHTPDALSHCLQTVRETTQGRVICVFGAGGNRDRSKRPLMAQASESADVVYVTSDNPRHESERQIIGDICRGFTGASNVVVCPDRKEAIHRAVNEADEGDSVVIAGRGHEKTQQIADRQICFDDRKVVRSELKQLVTSIDYVLKNQNLPISPPQVPA
jgi:UDP-N-acetylmuramoyl-L-alanyl-D-glutamate--2,6-diaminopimelate ligase